MKGGPQKLVVQPGRSGPVDQKRWRMPSEKPFQSVLAEAVTPPWKPDWPGAACTRPWLVKYTVTA